MLQNCLKNGAYEKVGPLQNPPSWFQRMELLSQLVFACAGRNLLVLSGFLLAHPPMASSGVRKEVPLSHRHQFPRGSLTMESFPPSRMQDYNVLTFCAENTQALGFRFCNYIEISSFSLHPSPAENAYNCYSFTLQ